MESPFRLRNSASKQRFIKLSGVCYVCAYGVTVARVSYTDKAGVRLPLRVFVWGSVVSLVKTVRLKSESPSGFVGSNPTCPTIYCYLISLCLVNKCMNENEKNDKLKESILANRLGKQFEDAGFGVKLNTNTWVEATDDVEVRRYPIISEATLKFAGGKTLDIYAEGLMDGDTGKVFTRLQLDFKDKPKPKSAVKPEVKRKLNLSVTDVKVVDCKTLQKEVRTKYSLPNYGFAYVIYYKQEGTMRIKYQYAGKSVAESIAKLIENNRVNRIRNLLNRVKP